MRVPNVRIVSATEAKNKFGEIIKRAYAADEHLIVEKSGIPVVAIIPMADYQQLVNEQTAPVIAQKVAGAKDRETAIRDLQEFLAQVHATMPDIPEEEADRDIAQAIAEVRAERAKRMTAESRAQYKTRRRKKK